MAFFDDGYTWHQQHNTYDPADYQDSVSFSDYEPYGLIVSKYQEPSGDYDYDYGCGYPDINYFAYNYEEPKLITYSVSYSKIDSGFNEPEFEEYDPTPYGGGYDIISAYGKPLPPSDRTCYPHSNQKHIPSVETKLQPEHESGSRPKPQDMHVPVVMPQPQPAPVPTPEGPAPDLEPVEEKERDEYIYPDHGYDYPWPEYVNGNRIVGVGYDYGYGKQVVQIPPVEYDPYVVDLCENLFGNWPCLARIKNQQMSIDNKPGITSPEIGHRNPMEECASYIFGRPVASFDHGYVD